MIVFVLLSLDLTTGQAAASSSPGSVQSTGAHTSGVKAGSVLWDFTHEHYLNYSLSGEFSEMVSTLNSNGYTIDSISNGINNVVLDNYDIVIINLGSNWNSAYSTEEADSLAAFVARGGSVLIQSENTNCPNSNLNEIVSRFEMNVGLGNPTDCITSFTSDPTYAAIFSGISQACGEAPGTVGAYGSSADIAWASGNTLMCGRCESNQGGVILVGDINIWDNSNIHTNDNEALLVNVFDWLSDPPCKPTGTEEGYGGHTRLRVWPSVAGDFVRVSLPSGHKRATVYNGAGAAVASFESGLNPVSGLEPGVYLIKAGNSCESFVVPGN